MTVQDLINQLQNCSLHKEVVISDTIDTIHNGSFIYQIVETDKIYLRIRKFDVKPITKKTVKRTRK